MRFGESKIINYCAAFFLVCACLTSASCQSKQENTDSILKSCRDFLGKNDTLAAGKCYENAIASNPKRAAEISKTFEDEFFKKCVEYKDKKDFKNAIVCLEGMSVLVPNSGNVHFLLADSYFQYDKTEGFSKSGDNEIVGKAEKSVKKGLKIRPEDATAHALYGEILDKKGSLQEALSEHRQAVKLEPKESIFLIKLALVLEKTNDFTTAIENYEKALELKPNDTLALYFLGRLYKKTGNTDKAIETLDKLFQIEPDYDKEAKEMLDSLKEKRTKSAAKTN